MVERAKKPRGEFRRAAFDLFYLVALQVRPLKVVQVLPPRGVGLEGY